MRKLTVLLIGAFMMAALFGCKGGSGEVRTGKKIVLKVLHHQDVSSPQTKIDKAIFDGFLEANPDIKLDIEILYSNEYHARVKGIKNVDEMPDLVHMWPGGRSFSLIKRELVEDLSPYLEETRENYVESLFTALEHDEKIYMVPGTLTATNVLYVNRALFKRYNIPMAKNFDELLALPSMIERKSSSTLITMGNKSSWVMGACLFSTIVGRLGGEDWAQKVVDGEVSFRGRAFIDSLYAVKNLYDTGALGKSGSLDIEYGDPPYHFAEGEAFIMIDGDWRTSSLANLMSYEEQENVELMALPALDNERSEKGATSIVAGTGFGMRRGLTDEKALAAWKFISYFAGPEASELRLLEQGVNPAYKLDISKLELSPLMRKRVEFIYNQPAVVVLDNVFPGKIIDRLNEGLQELGRGEISPERLARELDGLLKEWRK